MTNRSIPRFLPGETAPRTTAYHELDPWTWKIVRRLLVPQGDPFPDVKREGGFYTSSNRELEEMRSQRRA